MATNNRSQVVTGTIEAANANGIKLEGASTWYNFSRYARGVIDDQVKIGDNVMVTLIAGRDGRGFWIDSMTRPDATIEDLLPPEPPTMQAPTPIRQKAPATEPPSRDVQIARMAAMKAAVELIASDPNADRSPEAVVVVATYLAEWVMEP